MILRGVEEQHFWWRGTIIDGRMTRDSVNDLTLGFNLVLETQMQWPGRPTERQVLLSIIQLADNSISWPFDEKRLFLSDNN